MFRLRAAACLLTAALAGATPPGQQPAADCRGCAGRGSLPCGKHGKDLGLEADGVVLDCSVAATCRVCAGARAVDCRQCERAEVEAELQHRQQLARDWLQQRLARVDDAVGHHALVHLRTAHCDLVGSLKPATVGKQKLDTHALLHLHAQRLEALREDFRATLELTEADLPGRLRVHLFRDAKDHGVIGPRETGFGSAASTGLKQMGPEFVYSMWQDPRSLPDDEAVHRNVVHNVTHLLLSQMLPVQWVGNRGHGWVDEGLAHWFEDRHSGSCRNYCYEELLLAPGAGWKNGIWRPHVRKLVEEGGMPSFADLARRNTDQLTFLEHAAAFAYVDFLLSAHGGARCRDFVRALKSGQSTRDALQAVYSWNPLTIEAPFQAWIKAHYPLPGR
ncbi:MAG: hypothetical protein KF830_01125 [Planctomycetes bacterium]|nr:hypothetical protein [Planctomycetota bacterium]